MKPVIANKWNYEKQEYEPIELPSNCPLSVSPDCMEREIQCANCHKTVAFGDCYTSKTIHNFFGFGFPICEQCYEEEWEKERWEQ